MAKFNRFTSRNAPSAGERRAETQMIADSLPSNLRILELYVENVMRVKLFHIRPKRPVVIVSGKNESGKSSALNSIVMLLTGTGEIPTNPIRLGQRTATIKADIGGEFIVSRHFTRIEEGKSKDGALYFTKLTIEGKNREQYPSPQLLLNAIMGRISFDPLAFARMDDKAQLETLRGMMRFEIDIDELDREQKEDYDARRDAGRDRDRLKTQLAAMPAPAAGLPVKPIDTAAISRKLQEAANVNSAIERQKSLKAGFEAAADLARESALAKREQAEKLLAEAEALDGLKATVKVSTSTKATVPNVQHSRMADAAKVEIGEPVDTAAVAKELEEAQTTNQAIYHAANYATLYAQVKAAETAWTEIEERMQARSERRAAAIASAEMPVKGLAIESGEVIYDGLPFAQASSAMKIRVSTLLGMSSNPKLRVMQIRDGSLLDDDGLLAIADLAEAHDYQIFIERVDSSGKVGVVMEEGEASGEEVVKG